MGVGLSMSTNQRNGHAARRDLPARDEGAREPIAIVGIGCRFPGGVSNPEDFWALLESGTDAITEVPDDRWNARSFFDSDPSKPGKTYSRWGGFVEGIDRFDPHFFGISAREAARMDPQQRLLLEVAWEGLEDGGLTLEELSGSKASVFVGISSFDYSVLVTSFRDRGGIDVHSNTGGSLSIAANRISYCFNFRGPSVAVDTACSSALVAVHMACQSIWRDGCPLALAGGVNALLLPDWYVGFCRLGMLSAHGRCRAFAAGADGFVRSEGAGLVVLKPLARALADGDRVYAVIRGTAVNQDGRTPGMTVPSQDAQETLLRDACRDAGIAPVGIQYVEAHGTGTPVGDPIEARALGRVLSQGRPDGQPCLIGSVKTNIGHLEAGAGIASLIKAALSLQHRRVPGNLHFDRPNPEIDFDGLLLRVPTRSEPWPTSVGPATAGVNAFGFGGTNAHVILQQAPEILEQKSLIPSDVAPGSGRAWLIPLSARSPEALHESARFLDQFLARHGDVSLRDIAANAALRRTHHDHRIAVVARSHAELRELLRDPVGAGPGSGVIERRVSPGQRPRVAFVCSGQGPQWWAMGRELWDTEPVFRDAIERCDAIVRGLGEWSLVDEMTADEARSRMDSTAIAQPCLFALQVALAELWASWGVRPEAALGHSVGEVAAAHIAGAFELEDAVRIIYHRGRCMERAPFRGRMLAAGVSCAEALDLIGPYGNRVALAAVNSPTSVTLSGESDPLEKIAARLDARGVFCRFLKVQYAFHSAQMDPIRDELIAALRGIRPRASSLPLFSTVTGRRVEGPELGPEYWWRNVREAVKFADGIQQIIEADNDTILELGPHPVLAASVAECAQHQGKKALVLPSLRRHHDERATMLRSLGELYVLGYPIGWSGLRPGPHQFVRLPLYAWQRERFWHEAEESRTTRLAQPAHPLLGAAKDEPKPAWEARLDLRLTPYLADHRVRQAAILPATAYLEFAFAAGREAFGSLGCELRDLKLANPRFLSADEPLWTRSHFDPELGTIHIHTRPLDASRKWTGHLIASLQPRSADLDPIAVPLDALRRICPKEFARERCYEYLRMIGLDYGPAFQGIERVWKGDLEALGSVRLPQMLESDDDQYLFHPALLDACFQVVIPADADFDDRDGGLYLPSEIERVQLLRRPGRHVWVHARLREKTPRWSVADVDVYDESGQLAARVRGLRSKRVANGREESLDDLLYAYQWQPQPVPPQSATTPGRWLIFGDQAGLGNRLATRLRSRGDICTVAIVGQSFPARDDDGFALDATRPGDMQRILETVLGSDRTPLRGVIHLWNLDAPPSGELNAASLSAAQDIGLLSVIQLVQAWERSVPDQSAPLFLVTRGAQPVDDQPGILAMAQSPAIGLGRVIAGEYPRLLCRLVDLDPNAEDGGLSALWDEVHACDDEDEVAWRRSQRFAHRYLPAPGLPAGGAPRVGVPYRLAIQRPGTIDGLRPQTITRRPPARGEVEIEAFAAGLNFSDVMKALDLYPGLGDGPVPLGAECSGRVAAVGDGVTSVRVGDEVLAVAGFAFGSHVLTRAELVAHKPARLSFDDAATLPIAFLTAAYALEHLGRLSAGESVLIHSASGGVGLAAIQLARCAGAEVFATAGSDEKRDYLHALGIEHVMSSRSLAFADEVRQYTAGRGVDVILNSLPGAAITGGLAALSDYGRFLEIGKRDIYQNSRVGLEPFRRNLSFFAIDLDRVMRERPALLGTMLRKIVSRVDQGELAPLPHATWPVTNAPDAFRFMQNGKHIGKVVLSLRDQAVTAVPSEDEPVAFRADGTYLITGGMGGFGLAVARWMASRGAGNLVLLGRRGAHATDAKQAIADIEQLGARVIVRAGDVTKANDVAAVLAEIDRDLPPLRGVLHAAMVLEDALLINLDRDAMNRVLAPKISGSWNLHEQTAGRPLDLFVMFSSLSSVFGHAGQANYAAANAFLDALAWHRRALGLPALTVNWGYLGDVGYLADRGQLGERLERQGVSSFSVAEALALLEKVLQRMHTQVSVMRVNWDRWRGLGVTGRISKRFAHLCHEHSARSGELPPRVLPSLEAIRSANTGERTKLVETVVRDKVARVLGTTAERLDGEASLLQLGIDSLMAVELRNWIENELRVNVQIVELMRRPSVSSLVEHISELMGTAGDEPSRWPPKNGASRERINGHALAHAAPDTVRDASEILAKVDDLSGEQVDALLASLLSARGHAART